MKLLRTNIIPPGGWIYEQKETGFKMREMGPFGDAVKKLSQHRSSNQLARSTIGESEEDLHEFTCARLGNDPRHCSSKVKKNSTMVQRILEASPNHVRNLVARAGKAISNLGSGAKILSDWLGDGLRPVDRGTSQLRADVCRGVELGKPCPYNEPGAGSNLTAPIAEAIQRQMEAKHQTVQPVEGEAELHTCSVCWCRLSLKIHVPIETIINRTPQAMMRRFPDFCWIVKESQPQPPAQI